MSKQISSSSSRYHWFAFYLCITENVSIDKALGKLGLRTQRRSLAKNMSKDESKLLDEKIYKLSTDVCRKREIAEKCNISVYTVEARLTKKKKVLQCKA